MVQVIRFHFDFDVSYPAQFTNYMNIDDVDVTGDSPCAL